LQDPPKFTQIGIFGLKTNHLATQFWVSLFNLEAMSAYSSAWLVLINRVTRLGEFSPIGRHISVGIFYRISSNNWACFFHDKSYVLIFKKMNWATFGATFLQTHLVTLSSCEGLAARRNLWRETRHFLTLWLSSG
jgi:hypothetical protein